MLLEGPDGAVRWQPGEIAGRKGGSEVYRSEDIELRAGDRIRWTRNDKGLGLVNSRTAEVLSVDGGKVAFRLEDGKRLDLREGDPQLRHLDHAWASTVHAYQGRTVDNVIAAMEARHPHLTTQKSFYVEISRARDRAELVTDDAKALHEQLETATGERVASLEALEVTREQRRRDGQQRPRKIGEGLVARVDRETVASEMMAKDDPEGPEKNAPPAPKVEKTPAPKRIELDLGL